MPWVISFKFVSRHGRECLNELVALEPGMCHKASAQTRDPKRARRMPGIKDSRAVSMSRLPRGFTKHSVHYSSAVFLAFAYLCAAPPVVADREI
jgi:hypothetical protein